MMCRAQDSLVVAHNTTDSVSVCKTAYRFRPKQYILPAALITIGAVGSHNDWFEKQNKEIRDELQEGIDRRFTIDDISQYAPTAAIFGLKAFGVKSAHPFKQQFLTTGMAFVMMGVMVNTLKYTTRVERPDGSSRTSFPSGHTATAFLGADILYLEYKDVSPWIGYAGYAVAAGTGFFRLYNNRHWLTDIIAGAGIGMLSSRLSYWLYPVLFNHHSISTSKKQAQITAIPYCSAGDAGLAMSINF